MSERAANIPITNVSSVNSPTISFIESKHLSATLVIPEVKADLLFFSHFFVRIGDAASLAIYEGPVCIFTMGVRIFRRNEALHDQHSEPREKPWLHGEILNFELGPELFRLCGRWRNGVPRCGSEIEGSRAGVGGSVPLMRRGESKAGLGAGGRGVDGSSRSILERQLARAAVRPVAGEASYNKLRSDLYSRFRESGVISSLKTQLRAQILGQLQGKKGGVASRSGSRAPQTLTQRVLNGLVAEYLGTSRLHHSLSVFLPESGTAAASKESFGVTADDLLSLIRASGDGALDRHLERAIRGASEGPNRRSKLEALLTACASRPGPSARVSTGAQTADVVHQGEYDRVEVKLKALETRYRESLEKERGMPLLAMEERMQKYQRDVDARAKREIAAQVSRIRATDLAQIRVEERMRHRRELQVVQSQIEEAYKKRLTELREKEDALRTEIRSRAAQAEGTAYQQRQQILIDMEKLRGREAALKREAQQSAARLQLEQERLSRRTVELDRHVSNYTAQKLDMEGTLRQAREQARAEALREAEGKVRAALSAKLQDAKAMTSLESTLEAERKRVADLEAAIQSEAQARANAEAALQALQTQSKSSFETARTAQQQQAALAARIASVVSEKDEALSRLRQVTSELERAREQQAAALEASRVERKRVTERAATMMLQHKRNFEMQMRALRSTLQASKTRLALKTRQALQLDAQREADRAAIRGLERQVQSLTSQIGHMRAVSGLGAGVAAGAAAASTDLVVPMALPTAPSGAFRLDFSQRARASARRNEASFPPAAAASASQSNGRATQSLLEADATASNALEKQSFEATLALESERVSKQMDRFLSDSALRRSARGKGTWTANVDIRPDPRVRAAQAKATSGEPEAASTPEVPGPRSRTVMSQTAVATTSARDAVASRVALARIGSLSAGGIPSAGPGATNEEKQPPLSDAKSEPKMDSVVDQTQAAAQATETARPIDASQTASTTQIGTTQTGNVQGETKQSNAAQTPAVEEKTAESPEPVAAPAVSLSTGPAKEPERSVKEQSPDVATTAQRDATAQRDEAPERPVSGEDDVLLDDSVDGESRDDPFGFIDDAAADLDGF